MSSKSTAKLVGAWRLYEEGFEQRHIYLDFPNGALEGTAAGLRLTIPADVWEILRSGNHRSAPFHRMTPQQLRKIAELWVDHRLRSFARAADEADRERVSRRGALVANVEDARDRQVEDFIRFYSIPNPAVAEDVSREQLELDPDFDYSVYPNFANQYEGETNMERGSFCYFCGAQLTPVTTDAEGGCYECFSCPPVTHWRWNEDTEFLQLYVAGERCPFCSKQIPEPALMVGWAGGTEASPPVAEFDAKPPQRRKSGKPVTVDGIWWASVVEWCRVYNGHDTRNHHNCSKELARMQSKGEATVVWHNRDRIPGTQEMIASGSV